MIVFYSNVPFQQMENGMTFKVKLMIINDFSFWPFQTTESDGDSCTILSGEKSSILWSYLAHFSAQARKNKKNLPRKYSLYFRKWNFLALILKNSYIFSKENFSYIFRNGPCTFQCMLEKWKKSTSRKFLIFQEIELSNSNNNKFLIFQDTETPKNIFIFSQKKAVLIFHETETAKNSLYFRKRNFLTFREITFQAQKTKKRRS